MDTIPASAHPDTSRASNIGFSWPLGVCVAAWSGFVTVALGAFGAHGLESRFLAGLADASKRLKWWETATDYQMWHSLLVLALATGFFPLHARTRKWVLIWFCAGVLLFSGSLYLMTLTGIRALGAITPFGGISFLALWGLVARNAWRQRCASSTPMDPT